MAAKRRSTGSPDTGATERSDPLPRWSRTREALAGAEEGDGLGTLARAFADRDDERRRREAAEADARALRVELEGERAQRTQAESQARALLAELEMRRAVVRSPRDGRPLRRRLLRRLRRHRR